jgi:type III pantothenate kinase
VAGAEVIQFIIQALPAKLASTMSWLTGQTPLLGLHNHYSTPQTLGADRWLAIYGMLQGIKPTPPTPCILATFGTATTVDVLCWDRLAGAKKTIRNNISEYIENTDGFNAVFTGGIILAGLTSSWRNVSHSTAQLPDVAVLAATTSDTGLWHVPNNTQSALLQGAIWAQIGAVQAFSAQLATLHQEEPHVYLAGGAVQTLAPYLSHAKVLEYPVLMGLAAYQALK